MVDNRSNGFLVSAFSFKAGDASGMANALNEEKQGQGGEYFAPEENGEDENGLKQNEFVDRSAQLRGSLESLALLNAANINRIKKELDKKEKSKKNPSKKNKKNLDHMVDNYERDGN